MAFRDALKLLLKVSHEYAPGICIEIYPKNFGSKTFYPQNERAEKVVIGLEDGGRFMDKFLFETLYRVSVTPEIFSKEKVYQIPFTVKEFDAYRAFFTKALDLPAYPFLDECKFEEMNALYADYIKITNFLVPADDGLYAPAMTSSEVIETINLDLLPDEIADIFIRDCDIENFPHRRDLVRRVTENLSLLSYRDKNKLSAYLLEAKELILELGGDLEKMNAHVQRWCYSLSR